MKKKKAVFYDVYIYLYLCLDIHGLLNRTRASFFHIFSKHQSTVMESPPQSTNSTFAAPPAVIPAVRRPAAAGNGSGSRIHANSSAAEIRNQRQLDLEVNKWTKLASSSTTAVFDVDTTAVNKELQVGALRQLLDLKEEIDATNWMFDKRYS